MRPAPRQIPKVADVARATPEVVECHRVTGEDCFYMKLHVRSVEHLEEVIDRFTPYGQTTTSIIQSSPVARRGLELARLSADTASALTRDPAPTTRDAAADVIRSSSIAARR